MNKKIPILFLILIILIFFPQIGFAGRYVTEVTSFDNIMPDSRLFFFDRIFEEIDLFFTFNPKNKLLKEANRLLERVGESRQMIELKKPQKSKETLSRCERHLIKVVDKTNSLEVVNKSDEELIKKVSESILEHHSIIIGSFRKASVEDKKAIKRQIDIGVDGFKAMVQKVSDLEIKESMNKNLEKYGLENYMNVTSYEGIGVPILQFVSLSFVPLATSISVGEQFNLFLVLDTNSIPTNASEGIISFPNDKVGITGIDFIDSIFSIWIEAPFFSNQDGIVSFIGGVTGRQGFSGRDGVVLKLTFLAEDIGNAVITIEEARVLAADGFGTELDKKINSANIVIVP